MAMVVTACVAVRVIVAAAWAVHMSPGGIFGAQQRFRTRPHVGVCLGGKNVDAGENSEPHRFKTCGSGI